MRAGDRYTAKGVRFTVQFVAAGWVYGVRYVARLAPAAIHAAIDAGYDPPGYLGNCRVRLADFAAEVAGAVREGGGT